MAEVFARASGAARCGVVALAASFGAADVPSGLDADERVSLFPTAAALAPDGRHWLVPIDLVVFEPEQDDPLRVATLAPIRASLDFGVGTQEAALFQQRARLFLVDHERRERVNVALGRPTGTTTVVPARSPLGPDALDRSPPSPVTLDFVVGPTGAEGRARSLVELPVERASDLAPDGWIELRVGSAEEPCRTSQLVQLIGPEGLSVVSDLDDTIKVTNVRDKRATLANTFLRPFTAVPGMAARYQELAAAGAVFHYVSLSPWQLAPPLQEFLAREGFPHGSLDLQPFRLQDGDFAGATGDKKAKKLAAIEPLLARWPGRRFVLIGDSGELDPEIYAALARAHPTQIKAIWIRDVTEEPLESPRYAAAFMGLPDGLVRVFRDLREIRGSQARR